MDRAADNSELISRQRAGGLLASAHRASVTAREGSKPRQRFNVLVLYAMQSSFTNTVAHHLRAFREYSRHDFYYMDATYDAECTVDMNLFDAVILHYSCGLYHETYFSANFEDALIGYTGLKVAFIQDEYDGTERSRQRLEKLGVHVMYTCAYGDNMEAIYPRSRFPGMELINTLTGYIDESLEELGPGKPLAEREIFIGYRGRPLHLKYGQLGRDKVLIGKQMLAACRERGVACDIKWEEKERIYWDEWNAFIGNCRAMLGTESGSNVFDFDGSIKASIDAALSENPDADQDELYSRYVAEHDGSFAVMNQVSPKIFEAIAHRTALILYEGDYSGVVEPWTHYLPLKKDFSNVDEVLEKLRDDAFVQAMTDRAHRDVVKSGKYSYRQFVGEFDAMLERRVRRARGAVFITSVVATQTKKMEWVVFPLEEPEKWAAQVNEYTTDVLKIVPLNASLLNTPHADPVYYVERDFIADVNKRSASIGAHGGPWYAPFLPPIVYPIAYRLGTLVDKVRSHSRAGSATAVRPFARHLVTTYRIPAKLQFAVEWALVLWLLIPARLRDGLKGYILAALEWIRKRRQ